ncbi:MAG: hypothetical protein ACXV97_02270 [Chthoniobacterales bacterium]
MVAIEARPVAATAVEWEWVARRADRIFARYEDVRRRASDDDNDRAHLRRLFEHQHGK